MGVITVKLKDDVEKKLRELAYRKYGGGKGSMAKVIEEAIKSYYHSQYDRYMKSKKVFKVILDGKVIFKSNNLDEIKKFLETKGIPIRNVLITTEPNKKDYRVAGPRL